MNENAAEEQQIQFDPSQEVEARVVRLRSGKFNEKGAMKCYGVLMVDVPDEWELLANEEGEIEVKFSCAPWLGYLHPSIVLMAEQPEQRYGGFHLQTKDGYYNLVGLGGIAQPADWSDQLAAIGLGHERPKANGRPAVAPPLAPASGSSRRATATSAVEEEM